MTTTTKVTARIRRLRERLRQAAGLPPEEEEEEEGPVATEAPDREETATSAGAHAPLPDSGEQGRGDSGASDGRGLAETPGTTGTFPHADQWQRRTVRSSQFLALHCRQEPASTPMMGRQGNTRLKRMKHLRRRGLVSTSSPRVARHRQASLCRRASRKLLSKTSLCRSACRKLLSHAVPIGIYANQGDHTEGEYLSPVRCRGSGGAPPLMTAATPKHQ